jgi:hypothetical protein
VRLATLLVSLCGLAACKVYDPLYCEKNSDCTDPSRPFCDVNADYPDSEGVRKTCIPSPLDAGSGTVIDGGETADAFQPVDATPACAWAPLSPLANVNDIDLDDYAGSLSSDGSVLVFVRDTVGPGNDVYFAVRGSLDQPFGKPTLIEELSGDGIDRFDVEIAPSQQEVFFVTETSIETASRLSPTGVFGKSSPTGFEGFSPAMSADGRALYFNTVSSGVKVVRRSVIGGPWTLPDTVLPHSPASTYYSVDISSDELRLLVGSHPLRQDPIPILVAERGSIDEQFETPLPVNEEIVAGGGEFSSFSFAKWDASRTQMVASVTSPQTQGNFELYYSSCE